jgi:two-component system response regulator NreC
MNDIRVMLVDDHEVVRTGLRAYLQSQNGVLVVGEAGSGREALQIITQVAPDVVIMDITMPEMDGLEATQLIRQSCAECRVLALTVHADKEYFFKMLAAGAAGYVTKQAAADELVQAIRSVAAGYVYLQPALAAWLLEDYRRLLAERPIQPPNEHVIDPVALGSLSMREQQVVECVALGMTNNQIGEDLGISPKTVARHRERIMNKLNIHTGAELVHFAIKNGLIEI